MNALPTDRPTDTAYYRDARTHLKRKSSSLSRLNVYFQEEDDEEDEAARAARAEKKEKKQRKKSEGPRVDHLNVIFIGHVDAGSNER